MPQGTITQADRQFVETWENIAVSGNSIIRLDSRGEDKPELITGRRSFLITTEERMITEDRIVDDSNNPFRNGAFRPVVVPDSVDITSNPNALSDDEIRSVLVSSEIAWTEYMKVIDSPETLRRMVDLADEVEGLSLKRFKELGARFSEVKPKTQITQKDRAEYEKIGGAAPPAGPGAPARKRTSAGGRSADYR